MKRRILQAGQATLAVSLPMPWVKRFKLKKGQDIEVEEQGSSLKIKTAAMTEEDSAALNVSSLHPISTKIIGLLYKAGYKKIKALYSPNKTVIHRGKEVKEIDMIKNTFDHLIGMQLWELGKEKNENYAMVMESAKVNPKEFDNTFNQLYLHLIHQAEQVYEALSLNKDIFDEAYLAERLINQTADFCTRILVSFGHEEYKKTLQYYNLIDNLETIGDRYFYIALEQHENKTKINKEILEFFQKASGFIEESSSIYRKFDFDKIKSLTKELDETIKSYEYKIRKSKGKENLVSYNLYSIFLELYEIIEKLYFLNYDYFKE
ncbi:hypothetical protein A3K73_08925 [Candidatus Pacearchaeota archaeon RBG_13_36_9]|nr:MAG: hypothetical protein A3K73_08925 [Candidatus Pacearchaeota archaeon RBG_13_36_9]